VTLPNRKRLYIDQSGKLTSTTTPDPTGQFQNAPVHSGPIRVLLDYRSAAERQTVRAALNALTDVYALALSIDEKKVPGVTYDWVLTNSSRVVPEPVRTPKTFYTISGSSRTPTTNNVVFTAETLTPQTSELVAGGRLPEWLGEQLIRHYGLLANQTALSQQALTALFVPTTARPATQQAGVQNVLTLLFICLLLLERGLSLTKNA
jgi:hypothetical protein